MVSALQRPTLKALLVFDQGRIVERGSFQALLAEGGRFADLVKTQLTGTSE